jgi:glutamine cyclotransferase
MKQFAQGLALDAPHRNPPPASSHDATITKVLVMREILSRSVALSLLIGCCPFLIGKTSRQISANALPEYTFSLVRVFPHDTSAYTQGLAYRDGFLYEGTGRNGQSSLRKVRLETGEVIQHVDLGAEFFGEGITII